MAAAVILEEGSLMNDASLRAYAMEKLPDFKVPSRILVLDDIPKGPTGKLQRIGLAEKLTDHLSVSYEAPETEAEMLVCSTIAEVLDLETVGREDNFFNLGGDSLRATQVVSRINAKQSLDLPVMILFRFPTAKLLGEHIDSLIGDQELQQLADAMEGMSEEELKKLLQENSTAE